MEDSSEKKPDLDEGETDLGSDSGPVQTSEPDVCSADGPGEATQDNFNNTPHLVHKATQCPDEVKAGEKKQTEDGLETLKEVDQKLHQWNPQTISALFPPDHPDLPEVIKLLTGISDKSTSVKKPLQPKENAKAPKVKVFCVVVGKTFGAEVQILQRIKADVCTDPDHCDVVMLFCPICTRAAADVAEALRKIPGEVGGRPVILVMMYHTINKEYSVSSTDWTREHDNIKLSVSVLYHETESGLLECSRNHEAIKEIQQETTKHCKASILTKGKDFITQKLTSFGKRGNVK